MKYVIYQVVNTREFGFMGLDMMKTMGMEVKPENYQKVWSGESSVELNKAGSLRVLEDLFYQFNMAHPHDYKARSMSVSDVVGLCDEDGNWKYWFCDSFGWELLDGIPFGKVV